MNRRSFLASTGVLLADKILSQAAPAWAADKRRMHYALRIEPCKLEIAPGIMIDAIGYNGQVPGPLLRLREGVPTSIDVMNQSARAEIVHWHGVATDSLNDGAMEEGSPMIPAGGTLRYHLTPRPAGTRCYHTHATAGANLAAGGYTGQFGFLLVEGGHDPGRYDQEVFLAIHQFSGLRKDIVNVMPLDSVAVDFVADNPGDTLLHCHQALHLDFGFMQLMKYAG